MFRPLAYIAEIDNITPARNADRLEIAHINGWKAIVGKNLFKEGEKVVYAEIDSLIPVNDERFDLNDTIIKQAKTYDDNEPRYHVDTVKIRGNLSQGMLFPTRLFGFDNKPVDEDVTELLNIAKFDTPLPDNEDIIGRFPFQYAPKTDVARIQKLAKFYPTICQYEWVATEKIDGQSFTVIHGLDGKAYIASKNYELNPVNHPIWEVVNKKEFLENTIPGEALQGEYFGEGIQKNPLHISGRDFRIFNVYRTGQFIPRTEWTESELEHSVPVVENIVLPDTVDELLSIVDNLSSQISPDCKAEGCVFHALGEVPELEYPRFKVISNNYLLKGNK